MFDHFWMGREFTGSVVYYFTTVWHRKNLCKELYPNGSPHGNGTVNFYDNCAIVYSNHRGNSENAVQEVFFDFSDYKWSGDFR